MMKRSFETNIYGYPLTLVLLLKLAYSDGVDLSFKLLKYQ